MSSMLPGIPRLGQGYKGGLPGLTGLPGAPASPLNPGLPGLNSLPHVSTAPGTPAKGLPSPRQQQPAIRPDRIRSALRTLDLVDRGQLEPQKAQDLLSDLSPAERNQLTRQVLNDHALKGGPSPQGKLQALKYLPMGKSPGATALHDPNRHEGVGANLVSDMENFVTGIPVGTMLAGRALGQDLKDIPGNALHGRMGQDFRHTGNEIVKPMAKSYAAEYGPLGHGSLSGIAAHPLQPFLDATAIASAGLGVAGRAASVGDAIRAGQVEDLAGARAASSGGKLLKVYHGSTHALEGPLRGGDELGTNLEGKGIYFHTSPKVANQYTQFSARGGTGVAPSIRMAHVDPATLFDMDAPSALLDQVKNLSAEERAQVLQQHGYTGLKIANTGTAGGHEVMIFDPKDILPAHPAKPAPHPAGVAKVGGQYTVQEMKNGLFGVREGNQWISHNLPDADTAIAHAQSLISPTGTSKTTAFLKGGGDRGRLIDRYNTKYRAGAIQQGETKIAEELRKTMDLGTAGKLKLGKDGFKQSWKNAGKAIKSTAAQDKAAYGRLKSDPLELADSPSRPLAMARVAAPALYREAVSGIKHGTIYLRPAYLPNNWAGNFFMNAVHQGVLAPVNLAKSFMMTKALGDQYMAVIDKGLGSNAALALKDPKGGGYIASAMDPIVKIMGAAADQPFRRAAWLHEARRAGYNDLGKVKNLLDRAHAGDESAYMDMAKISRKAQEEIVKFGQLGDREAWIARNLFFVYSWVRGASRYAARYPLQHPITTNIQAHLSNDVGNPYIKRELGGVPSFLHGVIPVGHDKDGNPILINPFALNPLGTGIQTLQALKGTADVIRGKGFNKFTDTDITDLMNPGIKAYLTHREGGKSMLTQFGQTIAPLRLYHDLKHPGSGSLYPTSRKEALGKYVAGSLFPRKANAVALQRTLEREQRSDPVARMSTDMAVYKKALGHDIPQSLVDHYKVDIEQLKKLKDFQHKYASNHGQSGFRNLPPRNRAEAALMFLSAIGKISETERADYKKELDKLSTDAEVSQAASTLWGATGIGLYKTAWDEMMHQARGLRDSGKRK